MRNVFHGRGAIVAVSLCATCWAQPATRPKIVEITVDPPLPVLGPGTTKLTINQYAASGLADEHSTILPPATLPQQPDYLFFVASRVNATEHGTVVLQADPDSPPARTKSWRLDWAHRYGNYGSSHGPVFAPAMERTNCPQYSSAKVQDPTFDLNYAGVSTVFLDPTNPDNRGSGNLMMVYEGTNLCIGIASGSNSGNNFDSTIGIATSNDYGMTWPTYLANFTPLPAVNQWKGPRSPLGRWGSGVCQGNSCTDINILEPPNQYGRDAVSGAATTVKEAMLLSANGLAGITGDSEPAAFVDDVSGGSSPPYVYVVHTYKPGPFPKDSALYPQFPSVGVDLSVSRAQLNGGSARLQFYKWYQDEFTEPGLGSATSDVGGRESPIFETLGLSEDLDAYKRCLTPLQNRSDGSISYSEATQEYVLLFVCTSPTNPRAETQYPPANASTTGGAWFYSTLDAEKYDLSEQKHWSAPKQMLQSWSNFQSGGCKQDFKGWYPSMMSAGSKPGYLNTTGWVFFMSGCEGADPGRTYSTRYFTMLLQ
jgi:hypothetical protein